MTTTGRYALIYLGFTMLVAGSLACNAPTPTRSEPQAPPPTVTPYVPATSSPQATPSSEPTHTPESTSTSAPPTATEEATSVPPTATNTPDRPPVTASPSLTPEPTATATQSPPGEPLVITDPGFELVDWQALPDGMWEGHLRILFSGGVPPYTSAMQDREPQSENYHYIRWAQCRPAAWRANVWSADGQYAHKDVFIPAPYCP